MKSLFFLLSFSLLSCGVLIQAQTAGPGIPTVYRVSHLIPVSDAQSGCNWNTGLRTGGLACYNDVSYVNQALATATLTNAVDIVFDVSIGIGGPLSIPAASSVTIEGLASGGTGVFVLAGADSTAICTQYAGMIGDCQNNLSGLTPTPSQSGSLVVRNLGIDGNRGTSSPNTNSNNADLRCPTNWCSGMLAANLQYLEIDNVEVYDPPSYGLVTSNIGRQIYRNVSVIAPGWAVDTDGIHMDGPCDTYDIEGGYFQTGGDAITVNLPEGYTGNCGTGTITNITYNNSLTAFHTYVTLSSSSHYTLGPVTLENLNGTTASNNSVTAAVFRLGLSSYAAQAVDEVQSVKATNVVVSTPGYFVDISDNVGEFSCGNCTWVAPSNANPWFNFSAAATVSSATLTNAGIYRNATGNAAAYWGTVPGGSALKRFECNGCNVVNEQGQSYAALPYGWDVQVGGALGTFVMTAMDPANNPTLLHGSEWSRVTSLYGPGVSAYYRNTTYANLPPATYTGLTASIGDSNAAGVLGATEGGGSAGHYAEETSDGTNWTVTGK